VAQRPPSTPDAHPRIRTFHARHGRLTPQMRRALAEVAPRFAHDRRDRSRPLVLEVGCGNGAAAVAFAESHPDVDVLAADVHAPGVAQLLLRLEVDAHRNVYVHPGDALALLDDELPPESLAGVHVFFPDPWPKARHHKRRFVRPDVVDLLADRLADGGHLLFATDAEDYADAARALLDTHPAFDGGPAPRPSWRSPTIYEVKATDAGRAVHELAYRRVPR
jgi:tRNA (guanine-N7-)-methyltransferase